MKEKIEYYPNGCLKHKIYYYTNGIKKYELFYDEDGRDHRENGLPDYQYWHENGIIIHKTYTVHGDCHNIYNPSSIRFHENRKIRNKRYYLNDFRRSKLSWMNCIKKI